MTAGGPRACGSAQTRRFSRLTNAFGKKPDNPDHSVALHIFVYNFIIRHATVRMPPALLTKVTDHLWTGEELVELVDRPGVS